MEKELVTNPEGGVPEMSEPCCEDCLNKSKDDEVNHDSTSDVIGFSSDWFEVSDVFDEFPGT